jgi:cytochrome P450
MDGWRRHGDVVKFRVAGPNFLVVHPDHIKHILLDNARNYPHAEFQNASWRTIVGEGLVVSDGDFWLRQRRLMQPAFHRARIAAFVKLMTDTIGEMLDRWQVRADRGEALDMQSEMMQLTLNILARTMFSADVGPEAAAIGRAVTVELEYANRRLLSPVHLPESFPTPGNRRFVQARATLDRIVYRLIAERRKSQEDSGDLLSMLLNARDPETGESMTDRQLRDEVMMMFIAGHESTAMALTWAWYRLAMHPHARNRVRAEAEEVLGDRTPGVPDLEKLQYTSMVLDEAMRLYPPFWAVLRQPKAADEIGGYHIPAGANVFVSPYVTHRHPAFWENAEGFDPERFTAERSAGRHRYAYFPFGAGSRKCIGESFASFEMQLTVAMAAQRFRVDLVPGQDVALQPGLSLRPRRPILMKLAPAGPRKPQAAGTAAAPSH